ncbi:MAG: hypothetical protein KJ623_01865 [Nanoarchaeota archaeon]|nr:hypothetical protein [Nanoarchaeota archaeon]MBU0963010.1 hypothetical protein [Nanoarchaeota archaeon]
MDIRLNIKYQDLFDKKWTDSIKRSDHIIDRMRTRGIGVELIKEAVIKGSKMLREDKSIISEYRWFKIVYREFMVGDIKKVYPITVMEV